MKKYFKVISKTDGTYKIACDHRVLDIKDCRDFSRNYPSNLSQHMILNGNIHYDFFKQLTLQISPQIKKALDKEFEKDSYLAFSDRYFVYINNDIYILLNLHWSDTVGDYLWVKCAADPDCLNDIEECDFSFELCNEEESHRCELIRLGRTMEYWVRSINYSLSLYSKEYRIDSSECSYPDIIITCLFSKTVTDALKKQVYAFVIDFISAWNSNELNHEKIHDSYVVNSNSSKEVSVYIDFGNSESTALQSLLNALTKSHLNIKKITVC